VPDGQEETRNIDGLLRTVVMTQASPRHAEISIATDNETCPIPEGAEFRVRLASRRFFLAVPHNISFYDTLRKKMMWGVDIRS